MPPGRRGLVRGGRAVQLERHVRLRHRGRRRVSVQLRGRAERRLRSGRRDGTRGGLQRTPDRGRRGGERLLVVHSRFAAVRRDRDQRLGRFRGRYLPGALRRLPR